MPEYNIAWEVFMTEEQNALRKAIGLGQRSLLTQCVVEMTPQKEAELQKLMNQMTPETSDGESSVLKSYQIDRLKQGLDPSPQSPAEEAALQKLLDEEQLEKQKKYTKKKKVEEREEVQTEKAENTGEEVKDVKVEEQPEPKKQTKWKKV